MTICSEDCCPVKKALVILFCTLLLPTSWAARTATSLEPISIFVDAQDGFSGYIVAAFQKKGTPASVVMDRNRAQYVLQSSAVSTHQESGAGKVARCLFAYCAGIQDTSTVSVELINAKTTGVDWSYTVHKQRGGGYNQQSMAEAIAKHLKNHLEGKGE
jgi:hypothetical protein